MVTTGGLVFIAAAMDTYLRSFDIEIGKEIRNEQVRCSYRFCIAIKAED